MNRIEPKINLSLKDWFFKHRVSAMYMGSNYAWTKLIDNLSTQKINTNGNK